MTDHIITDLRDLTRAQIDIILDKAEIKAEGTFKPPPLDLDAIQARADELDPKSQIKADLYRLIMEFKRPDARQAWEIARDELLRRITQELAQMDRDKGERSIWSISGSEGDMSEFATMLGVIDTMLGAEPGNYDWQSLNGH